MAFPSAFHERLEQMEQTRNQRISLLHAERELQIAKSKQLATKISDINLMEQRCLKFDQKIASQQCSISSLKSEINSLESKYDEYLQQIRVLHSEVEDLAEMEKEKEKFYSLQKHQMDEFSTQVNKYVVDGQLQVQKLRNTVNELNLSFMKLQGDNGCLDNTDIAIAEIRKHELLAAKENMDRSLSSNCKIKEQLQKQLRSILSDKRNGSYSSKKLTSQ